MNVTAKYSNGAVHLGGGEMMNGRWSPACGVMSHGGGGREPKPLYPTDKPVTCKRCLKKIAARSEPKEIPNYAVQEIKVSQKPRRKTQREQTGMDSLRDMLKLS